MLNFAPFGTVGCLECRSEEAGPFSGIYSAFRLTPSAKNLLHQIKYANRRELMRFLALPYLAYNGATLVPVPMTKKKYLDRGFNPAAMLAKSLAAGSGNQFLEDGLIKTKDTAPQALLKIKERTTNLKNAFHWNEKWEVPERVCLVDDIWTTGSTLRACAKALKKAGVKEISAWTYFRTPAN